MGVLIFLKLPLNGGTTRSPLQKTENLTFLPLYRRGASVLSPTYTCRYYFACLYYFFNDLGMRKICANFYAFIKIWTIAVIIIFTSKN